MKNSTFLSKLLAALCILCVSTYALDAAIVTGTVYTTGESIGLDFNNDGTIDFFLTDAEGEVVHTNGALMFNWSEGGNNIWTTGDMTQGGWDVIKPLTAGTSIGSGANWEAQGDASIVDWSTGGVSFSTGISYVGFRIKIGSNTHYGWAKVNVTGSVSTGLNLQWQQIAYQDTPNTAINAGDLGGGTAIANNNAISTIVYPNPTSNFVIIQGDFTGEDVIQLFDFNGKLMFSQQVTDEQNILIDMTGLCTGMYLIKGKNFTVEAVKK